MGVELARVIGIDPGSRVTGWGVVERRLGGLRLVACGTLRLGEGSVASRLAAIHTGLSALLREHEPEALAIEEAYLGRNVRSTLRLAEARAVAILAAELRELPIHELPPALVKKSVTGHGRASKDAVRHAVMRILEWEESASPPPYDASDALAVGLGTLLRLQSPHPGGLSMGRRSKGRKRWSAADLERHQAWTHDQERP